MSRPIEIKNQHSEKVAEIAFVDDPVNLGCFRTTTGFKLSIPAKLSLVIVRKDDPIPMISNLKGDVFVSNALGITVDVGRLEHDSWHSAGWSSNGGWSDPSQILLMWRGTLNELAFCEKLREGREPQFQIQLRGELCYLLPSGHPRYQIRTHPQLIYGDTTIRYPKEVWVKELRKIGVLENVLVEVPLPRAPPEPWDRVWENLIEARDAFEHGGSTGWNGCVLGVRQALEKWKDIEGQEQIPSDLRQRSKRERLTNLRHALHNCAHLWIHDQDDCSRDDALLMLSTLAALLAERKP